MQLTQSQVKELAYHKKRLNNLTWVRLFIYMLEEVLRRIPEQEHHFSMFQYGICYAVMHLEGELVEAHNQQHKHRHVLRCLGAAFPLVTVLAMNWEHTRYPDQNDCNPVPFDYSYPYWEGPNLEMRISLINHCLAYLRYQRSILEHRS